MKKVGWGVMGAGGIALRRTIPDGLICASNAMLVAVQNPSRVDSIAQTFGVIGVKDEAALLAQPIDAVYIATPVDLHRGQVERAAAAGKHVLCEKPLGLDLREAEVMADACRRAGVKFGVGLMMRFHAGHQLACAMIAGGQLGKPTFARAQLSCWYPLTAGAWRQDPKRSGGGALADLGTHCLDLLEMCFGPIARVSCQVGHLVQGYAVEDSAVVSLTFANGAMGVVDCAFNVPDETVSNRLELYGSEGSLLFENTIGQCEGGTMIFRRRAGAAGYDAQQVREGESQVTLTPDPVNLYRAQIEAFSQAILDDVEPPVSGVHGVRVQRLLQTCYASALDGRSFDV